MRGWGGVKIEPNDIFITPPDLVRYCLEVLEVDLQEPQISVLDPCAGNGAWSSQLEALCPHRVWSREILQGLDFYDETDQFDWIIGIPPFSNLDKWLSHSSKIARRGIAYTLPGHALSYSRLRLMESFGWFICGLHSFENPKTWNNGFPHFFVIWRKNPHLHPACRPLAKTLGEPTQKQVRLGEFE